MKNLREINHHQLADDQDGNNAIMIHSTDEPGSGGAHHRYMLNLIKAPGEDSERIDIRFQEGTVLQNGVNGLTIESLLALCLDRLECFQEGQFANQSNQTALDSIQAAMDALQSRTLDRINRGVKGKLEK